MKKNKKDPIAEKLHKHFARKVDPSTLEPIPGTKWKPMITSEQMYDIASQMNKLSADHPMADYDTMDYYASDDDQVLEFVRRLGLNPDTIDKMTIEIENNQPLKVHVSAYVLKSERNGSSLKSWEQDS